MVASIRYIDCPAGRIAWARVGDIAPDPLVVLHGLGDSAIYTGMPIFANGPLQGTSALFIDLPGFGASTASADFDGSIESHASAVEFVLTTLGIGRARIFGHSMGGNTAITLAHTYPHLVSQVILAEPLLRREHSVLATTIARWTADQYEQRGHRMLIRATRMQAARGEIAASTYLPALEMANARIMHASATSLVRDRSPAFREQLLGLPHPWVLLIGEHTLAAIGTESLDGMAIEVIPNAGHFILAEQPDATSCAILKAIWGPEAE